MVHRDMPPASHSRALVVDGLLLALLAAAIRLALLPLASQDTNDHSLRLWIAQRLSEDPFLLLHGHWPPLHFYLLAPVIGLTGDLFVAPILLQIALSAAVPPLLYMFARREFRSRGAALAVGVAYALYPISIRTTLEALAQAPFSLCVAGALLALSHARDESAGWRPVILAGVAATLSSLLRIEGWLLLPLLAATLLPRLDRAAVFAAIAAIGPLLLMAVNAIHYGDPLFPLTTVVEFELDLAGREHFTPLQYAGQVGRFLMLLAGGMTPLLALACGLGGLACLLRRQRAAVWLIPAAGLTLILLASVARGSTAPKAIYTDTLGLLWLPFLAALLTGLARLGPRVPVATAGVVLAAMLAQIVVGTARDIPGLRASVPLLAALPMPGAAPTFAGRATLEGLVPLLRARAADRGAGLVIDALGVPGSYWLGWQSRFHPDRIFIASAAPNVDPLALPPPDRRALRARAQPLRDSEPLALDQFLRRYCSGLLVLQPGSRFAAALGLQADRAALAGVTLRLEPLATVPWPLPADPRLRAPGAPAGPGEATLLAYRADPCDA